MNTHSPSYRLYHYWRSSCSWRVRWATQIKGIQSFFELVPISLVNGESESPAHLARSPLGYVPVLEILNPPQSSHFLTSSMAILHYLESIYPETPLLPRDPWLRAQALQLTDLIASDTQPLQNLNATHHHSSDPAEQKRWMHYWIERGLQAYETMVAKTAGRFSVGDQLSFADLALIPQCYNARRNEVALAPFPVLSRIEAEARKLPSYAASAPESYAPENT